MGSFFILIGVSRGSGIRAGPLRNLAVIDFLENGLKKIYVH